MSNWFFAILLVMLVNINIAGEVIHTGKDYSLQSELLIPNKDLVFKPLNREVVKDLLESENDHTHEEDKKPDFRFFSPPSIVGTASLPSIYPAFRYGTNG